jgi:hypothetical protein
MGYSFKDFILFENSAYFSERIGDLLNAVQDLVDNGSSMGTRQLVKKSEGIVNQIRRILHTNWPKKEENNLEKLQDVGCAISRAIEEKDDLINILTSVKSSLEELSTDLGQPVQRSEKEQKPEETGLEPSQPENPPEKQPSSQPQQSSVPPPGGQMPGGMPQQPTQMSSLPGNAPPGGVM